MDKPYYRPQAPVFWRLHKEGLSNDEIANRLKVHPKTLSAGISEFRKYLHWKSLQESGIEAPQPQPIEAPEEHPPTQQLRNNFKPNAIRQLTSNNNDRETFFERYLWFKKNKRFLRIFFPFDKHIPFHDKDAVKLDAKIMTAIGADIIIHGSDVFDFPTISRHEPDYELQQNPSFDDVFDNIKWLYELDTDMLLNCGKDPLIGFIYGNHDKRFLEMALKSDVPRLLIDTFVDMIKHKGHVHYLGFTQELLLDTLFIRHDGGTSKHTAANMLLQDNGVHHVAGHTHRSDYFSHTSKLYRRHSMVVGCRCELLPHYQTKQGKYTSKWNQSLGYCILDTHTGNVQMNNIEYYRDNGYIYGMVNDHVYHVKISENLE